MIGFSTRQLKKLATSFDPSRIRSREQDGKTLLFIEGWFAISEANRVFGYDGWDRETVHFERCYGNFAGGKTHCGYIARVRVRVRAGTTEVVREGSGFGSGTSTTPSEAHDIALKGAETDATKRALATFGNRFGLLLYDKDQQARLTKSLAAGCDKKAADERPPPSQEEVRRVKLVGLAGGEQELSPESFFSAMRQMVERCENAEQLKELEGDNRHTMEALRLQSALKTKQGQSYSAVLDRLIDQRRESFPAPVVPVSNSTANDLVVDRAARQSDPTVLGRGSEHGHAEAGNDAPKAQMQTATSSVIKADKAKEPIPPYPLAQTLSRVKMPVNPHILAIPPTPADYAPDPAHIRPIVHVGRASSVDKSALHFGADRKIRNKAHLAYVSSKPCLVCEQLPCHAHHLRFAQKRGMSQKVSDEFTVPLCAFHHNELHQAGSEIAWWHKQGLEPLKLARDLWDVTVQG